MSEHNNAPAVPQGAPEINYPALIEAAFAKNRKWTQGTTGCIAFARGAEWFRDQMLAATPAPAPASGILDRARWGEKEVNLMRLAEAADKAVASMTVPAPEAGSESKIVIDVGPGGSGGGPAEAAPPATEQTAPAPAQEVGLTDEQADAVSMALRRAWQLGQTYWQQADSDYISQYKKSGETQRKFEELCDDTISALRAKVVA
jgi:hypothetical protein